MHKRERERRRSNREKEFIFSVLSCCLSPCQLDAAAAVWSVAAVCKALSHNKSLGAEGSERHEVVLFCGSFYILSEVRSALRLQRLLRHADGTTSQEPYAVDPDSLNELH